MGRVKIVDYKEKYNVYYLQYNAIQTLCNKRVVPIELH